MSVAFRRDGDDEHLEPTYEIPIPPGPNLVTPNGLARIRAEVAKREALLLTSISDDVQKAVRRELRYWSTRQSTAELAPTADGSHVAFGCIVTYHRDGQTREIGIVGDDEADPETGRIAYSAPLCRALMGAEVGDILPFAGRIDAIEIIAIRPA